MDPTDYSPDSPSVYSPGHYRTSSGSDTRYSESTCTVEYDVGHQMDETTTLPPIDVDDDKGQDEKQSSGGEPSMSPEAIRAYRQMAEPLAEW